MSKKEANCEFDAGCDCHRTTKSVSCESCQWYRMIDSGYGVCNTLPTHHIVPWCKEPCSLFGKKAVA
jgi:hypothetical protein